MIKGALLLFIVLGEKAFASDFFSCALALKGDASFKVATPHTLQKYTFNNKEYQIPQEAFIYAERIASDESAPLPLREEYMKELESLFGQGDSLRERRDSAFRVQFNNYLLKPRIELGKRNNEEVTVITHQRSDLQDASSDFVGQNGPLANIPVISLASASFPLQSKPLLNATHRVQLSELGELSSVPRSATTFNLLGGYCNHCLSESIGSILATKAAEEDSSPINLYVYTSKSYMLNASGVTQTASDILGSVDRPITDVIGINRIRPLLPANTEFSSPTLNESPKGRAYTIAISGPRIQRPLRIHILAQ